MPCSVREFGRIGVPPGQDHLLGQLGMVRLELGGGFRETHNDGVDRRRYESKQGGAQDKSNRGTHEKGTGRDGPVLLHQVAHRRAEDSREDADADAHHEQHRVDKIICDDRGPTPGFEELEETTKDS